MDGFIIPSILVFASIIAIVILTAKLKLNVFGSLFAVSFVLAICTIPLDQIIKLLKTSFGATMGNISFIIIFGTVIAICMERSGAVLSIANNILKRTGKHKAKSAMALTGFIPGMTIFCDTGYIILNGIARNFSGQSKTPMPLMAAILGLSLYSVHCLVPTHPGALGAATTLKANIGYLVIFGALIAIPALIVSCLWANKMCKGMNYEPAPEHVEEKTEKRVLPSFFDALIPVVLPLVLISVSTLLGAMKIEEGFFANGSSFAKIINFFGDPVIALLAGAFAAFFLLVKTQKRAGLKVNVNEILDEAIHKAGPILIITAAGGMFGAVITATGVGGAVGKVLGGASLGLLIPFLIAAFLKTAQGSSTIAALTTAGIMAPVAAATGITEPALITSLGLDSEFGRVFTVLAIGAGSVMVSHANDSYFWVITKFSNIQMNESLRVYTTSTFVMGITMFLIIWATSLIFI